MTTREQAIAAKQTCLALRTMREGQKNKILATIRDRIKDHHGAIIEANKIDLEAAEKENLSPALIDRLRLTEERLFGIESSIDTLIALDDPIGRGVCWQRPNGLKIKRIRVPLGLLCMVYEARPNVTVEAATLSLKSGNACILRGSRSAMHSNLELVTLMREALQEHQVDPNAVTMVEDLSRSSVQELAEMRGVVDCMIPRGGAGLIQSVVAMAKVPVIETGVGNCHIYIDDTALEEVARNIVLNAKIQRPGVCNAVETLLIHQDWDISFTKGLLLELHSAGVELRGCAKARAIGIPMEVATEDDWADEFHDTILAVKIVETLDEALAHINLFTTGHTEAIVSRNVEAIERFQEELDSCAININASTRFTDGGEYGFGAEIGISTQKLHARGPLGLPELTSTKYIVEGQGHIR